MEMAQILDMLGFMNGMVLYGINRVRILMVQTRTPVKKLPSLVKKRFTAISRLLQG